MTLISFWCSQVSIKTQRSSEEKRRAYFHFINLWLRQKIFISKSVVSVVLFLKFQWQASPGRFSMNEEWCRTLKSNKTVEFILQFRKSTVKTKALDNSERTSSYQHQRNVISFECFYFFFPHKPRLNVILQEKAVAISEKDGAKISVVWRKINKFGQGWMEINQPAWWEEPSAI